MIEKNPVTIEELIKAGYKEIFDTEKILNRETDYILYPEVNEYHRVKSIHNQKWEDYTGYYPRLFRIPKKIIKKII